MEHRFNLVGCLRLLSFVWFTLYICSIIFWVEGDWMHYIVWLPCTYVGSDFVWLPCIFVGSDFVWLPCIFVGSDFVWLLCIICLITLYFCRIRFCQIALYICRIRFCQIDLYICRIRFCLITFYICRIRFCLITCYICRIRFWKEGWQEVSGRFREAVGKLKVMESIQVTEKKQFSIKKIFLRCHI